MRHQPNATAGWGDARLTGTPSSGLPAPLDCETRTTLRLFLEPIISAADSWPGLAADLLKRGYALGFREGHLVILNDTGAAVCTGSDLGIPMASISARIGRPCVRAHAGGHSGELDSRG
ncbi:hypothetical protein [Sagittula sp. S175]|uniref:hypothetical protein n=1 Tax=Sagittula sp. S175 TaxID=3415129 RepID=UPI003C7D30E1